MFRACTHCGVELEAGSQFCRNCGSPVPIDRREDPYVGRVLGNRFEIRGRVAEGGMGRVYRATDLFTGADAAVKVLLPEFLRNRELVERFSDEGRSLFNVSHPNIVKFLAFWLDRSGEPYLIMEYLEGRSLGALLAEDRCVKDEEELVSIASQALDGLHHLHSLPSPLVHRDIKPDNVWLLPDRTVKLMDLGIARDAGAAKRTRAGQHVGTLEYMSPEQIRGSALTPATDQYSMGVTMFHMACGTVPFPIRSETGVEVMTAHCNEAPPDPRDIVHGVPGYVADAILRCLAKDPGDRFPSCFALKKFLLTQGEEDE